MSSVVKPVSGIIKNVPIVGAPVANVLNTLGTRIGQGTGLDGPPSDPYAGQLDDVQKMLMAKATGGSPIAQAQYKNMANEGLQKSLATIASQRSLRPSEQANLASRGVRDTQMDIAGKGAILGLTEEQQNLDMLAKMLLARSGAGMAQEQATSDRLAGLLGVGASAAGKMATGGAKPV